MSRKERIEKGGKGEEKRLRRKKIREKGMKEKVRRQGGKGDVAKRRYEMQKEALEQDYRSGMFGVERSQEECSSRILGARLLEHDY